MKALLGGAVALAGAITAIAAALYIVAPQLAPRAKLGAELNRVAVEQAVDYEAYREQLKNAPNVEPSSQNGVAVLVRAGLTGFEDRSYSVEVDAYNADNSIRIYPDESSNGFSSTCEAKSPKAREDSVAWICWLVAPPEGTKFFVRAQLYEYGSTEDFGEGNTEQRRELLDFYDSAEMVSVWKQE